MEVKLHADAERVLEIIRMSIRQERMAETPENIVDAAVAAFLEMSRRRDCSRMSELLQIVLVHRDFLRDDAGAAEFVRVVLDFKDEKTYSQGFRIIRQFMRSGRLLMSHFRILLEDCFGKTTHKTKSIVLIKEFAQMEAFRDALVEHILRLTGVDFVRHINCFFDDVSPCIDVRARLDEFVDAGLFADDTEDARRLYSECCDLIHNYAMRSVESAEEEFGYIAMHLKTLFGVPFPRGDKLVRTFSILSERDLLVFLRENRHVLRMDVEIKRHVMNELLEAKLKNEQIYAFMRSVRHILVPEFMELIRQMAGKYVEGDTRYYFALGTVVNILGAERFFELLDIPVDIRTWASVVRGSSNDDLSFFVKLYRQNEQSLERTTVLNCLPAFCNYGSDHEERIEEVLQIMRANVGGQNAFSSICTALSRLIHSHQANLRSELILRNPIPVSASQRILQAVHSSSIALDILNVAMLRDSNESDDALFKLMETNDFGLTSRVFGHILQHPDNATLQIGNTHLDISDVLRIARFFVPRISADLDIVSKVLELSLSQSAVQKKAYQLLYHMQLHDRIGMCICDSLFSEEASKATSRWRVSLIHLVYERGCLCFPARKREYLNRMLPVVILGLKTGNAKTRKTGLDVLEELVGSFDEADFDFYCRLMVAGMSSENIVLRCGILEALTLLVESHSSRLSDDVVDAVYSSCVATSRTGKDAVLHVLRFLGALMKNRSVNPQRCIEVLELYADSYRSKYMRDIKQVVSVLAERDVEVPKKLRRLINTQPRGPVSSLQITKKNDVVIREESRARPAAGHRKNRRRSIKN